MNASSVKIVGKFIRRRNDNSLQGRSCYAYNLNLVAVEASVKKMEPRLYPIPGAIQTSN